MIGKGARERLNQFKSEEAGDSWASPRLSEMVEMKPIIAFDQTLSNTGWVCFKIVDERVKIVDRGTIKPKTKHKSFQGTYDKGNQLAVEVYQLLDYNPCRHIAYEMPAVHGYRTESALLAGFIVQREAERRLISSQMYPQQRVRARLGGPSCKDKQALSIALERYVPEISTSRKWNEHERDAMGIGLLSALELGEANDI